MTSDQDVADCGEWPGCPNADRCVVITMNSLVLIRVPGWVAPPASGQGRDAGGPRHVYDVITLSSHKMGRAALKIVLTQSVAQYTSMFSQEPVALQVVFVGRTPDR